MKQFISGVLSRIFIHTHMILDHNHKLMMEDRTCLITEIFFLYIQHPTTDLQTIQLAGPNIIHCHDLIQFCFFYTKITEAVCPHHYKSKFGHSELV